MTNGKFSGTDSALGYYYQSLYALVYLLNSKEDTEEVLIEDLDDVVVKNIEKNEFSLKQLKHKKKSVITIASKDLWSTLRIWCEYTLSEDIRNISFHLITCSEMSNKNILNVLRIENSDRSELIELLNNEAERVIDERLKTTESKKPHSDRHHGCEAYIQLSESQKKMLLDRVMIMPEEFHINETEAQVNGSNLLQVCPPDSRQFITKKLIQWWDYQVLLQMRKERSEIKKIELQHTIIEIIQEVELEQISNSYGGREPLNWEDELTDNIAKQLEIINIGNIQKKHAAINYWQARKQREEWLEDDFPLANEKVKKFDKNLFNEWEFLFGDKAENREFSSEGEYIECGKEIFNWSFQRAHETIPKISKGWQDKYLVRGSYQILSDALIVGWHPLYKTKFAMKK